MATFSGRSLGKPSNFLQQWTIFAFCGSLLTVCEERGCGSRSSTRCHGRPHKGAGDKTG